MTELKSSEVITVAQAATIAHCKPLTIRRWIKAGLIDGKAPSKGKVLINKKRFENYLNYGIFGD